MDWQDQLVTLYLYVCKHYQQSLWTYCQRMSTFADLSFSDEEVITLYLFGVIDKMRTLKKIYTYAVRHLRDWFPRLPSYVGFVQRLNKVADVFAPLLTIIQQESGHLSAQTAWLIDSFPVALAKQGHRFKAKVAPELADHGYCSTKKLYYYGVRVHVVGRAQAGTLPSPDYIGVTGASDHDGKVLTRFDPNWRIMCFMATKPTNGLMPTKSGKPRILRSSRPLKNKKGSVTWNPKTSGSPPPFLVCGKPIEALFGWIEQQTGIECAAKVRSYKGLMVHVFGKLAGAMFFWNFLRASA